MEPYMGGVPIHNPLAMSGRPYDVAGRTQHIPQHRHDPRFPPPEPHRQQSHHETWVPRSPAIDYRSPPERLRGPGVPGDPYPPMRPSSPSMLYAGQHLQQTPPISRGSPSRHRDIQVPYEDNVPRDPSTRWYPQLPPLSIPSAPGRSTQPAGRPPHSVSSLPPFHGQEPIPSGIPPPFTMEPQPLWSQTPLSGSPASPFARSSVTQGTFAIIMSFIDYWNSSAGRVDVQHVEGDVVGRDRRHSSSSRRNTGTRYDPVYDPDPFNGTPGPSR